MKTKVARYKHPLQRIINFIVDFANPWIIKNCGNESGEVIKHLSIFKDKLNQTLGDIYK